MGKKQRAKHERQVEQRQRPVHQRPGSGKWLPWVLGVGVFVGIVVAFLVYYVQSHKLELTQAMVFSTAQKVEADLSRNQGQFGLDEARRLQNILISIQRLAGDKDLDLPVAGHLNFLLQVTSEIVKNGNLEPGELEKLNALLLQAQLIMEQKKRPNAKP
jgi:hypothetical protein